MSSRVDGGPERTPDGRCWWCAAALAAGRARAGTAKRGLGERGAAWWDEAPEARRARWEAALAALDGR